MPMSTTDNMSETASKDFVVDNVAHVSHMPTIAEQQEKRKLFTYSEGQKILRKVDLRFLPLVMVVYTLRAMDGSAISYVKTMNTGSSRNILKMLHMTSNQYAYTSTVFTLFYILGELPSNLMFKKATPRWHYIRIITLWSIAAACQAAAYNEAGILVARSFLGLFEAGLAPGVYLHLTYWYRPDEVGVRIASISALYQFANIFNALLTWGLSYVNSKTSLAAWQWVFIIQGLLGFVFAGITYLWMPNFPDTCKWLSPDEREWIVGRLPSNSARKEDKNFDWRELKQAALEPANLAFSAMMMLFQCGLLGYLFWLPTIIAGFGVSSKGTTQLLNIPPAFLYWVGGVIGCWLNDRLTMIPRAVCFIFATMLWTLGLIGLAFIENKGALYAIVCLASLPASWAYQTFLPWRAQSVRGTTHAAFLMAWINASGQVPGLFTAQIFRSQYAPRYTVPFMVCVGVTVGSAVMSLLCWYLTYGVEKETRRIAALRRKVGKEQDVVLEEDVELGDDVRHRNDRP